VKSNPSIFEKSYVSGSSESGISSAVLYFYAYACALARAFLNSSDLSPNLAFTLTSVLTFSSVFAFYSYLPFSCV
jgi:hypothetical protein